MITGPLMVWGPANDRKNCFPYYNNYYSTSYLLVGCTFSIPSKLHASTKDKLGSQILDCIAV